MPKWWQIFINSKYLSWMSMTRSCVLQINLRGVLLCSKCICSAHTCFESCTQRDNGCVNDASFNVASNIKCQTPLHGHRLRTCCTKKTHQRTSWQQFCNLLYSKFTTNGRKFATSQHLDMSRCWALALRCGKFVVQQVVELLWACPLVVLYNTSVAGVRVVEFGT